jgi:hypothetical protein
MTDCQLLNYLAGAICLLLIVQIIFLNKLINEIMKE